MKEIRIYVEGGGQSNTSRRQIRLGFNEFLSPIHNLARSHQIHWEVIPCGPRESAFKTFKFGLKTHPHAFNILLVDSEAKVTQSRWEHLRRQDHWQVPDLAEEHCHFMVCTIEAWLVADPDALAKFYGKSFNSKVLPAQPDVETVEKETLMSALNRATERTQKGPYHKINHCSELLKRLDPARVRARARHCDLLFKTLEAQITG
ncbi:MAG TPA: DUF4276 family protein [Thermoanaerobaculia bacterium]